MNTALLTQLKLLESRKQPAETNFGWLPSFWVSEKTNTSTVKNDIPAKLIKEFAPELSGPLANILNCMVTRGEFPNIWKLEMVTPVAKKYPPATIDELRKILGLKNCTKIAEKIFGDFIIKDTSKSRDSSQYGNEKGISINHYLKKLSMKF